MVGVLLLAGPEGWQDGKSNGEAWASSSRNCGSQEKNNPHLPGKERSSTFPESGVEQSPPSTGFPYVLIQRYKDGGCALGAGSSALEFSGRLSPKHPFVPESSPAPLYALEVGPGPSRGFRRCGV